MTTQTLQFYHQNALDLTERYETADVAAMHAHLLEAFTRSSKLLEIGCGSGRDAAFMVSNGYDVTAVDGSQAMIDAAQELHPELSDSLHVVLLPDGLEEFTETYDGIYSVATLMHLDNEQIESSIQHISNLLKTGGTLFFSVSIARDDVDEKGYDAKGRYFNSMSKDAWMAICESHGFKCITTKQSGDGLGRDGITWLTVVAEKVK